MLTSTFAWCFSEDGAIFSNRWGCLISPQYVDPYKSIKIALVKGALVPKGGKIFKAFPNWLEKQM